MSNVGSSVQESASLRRPASKQRHIALIWKWSIMTQMRKDQTSSAINHLQAQDGAHPLPN